MLYEIIVAIRRDQEQHAAGALGQEDRGPARGVAATHQDHVRPSAHLPLNLKSRSPTAMSVCPSRNAFWRWRWCNVRPRELRVLSSVGNVSAANDRLKRVIQPWPDATISPGHRGVHPAASLKRRSSPCERSGFPRYVVWAGILRAVSRSGLQARPQSSPRHPRSPVDLGPPELPSESPQRPWTSARRPYQRSRSCRDGTFVERADDEVRRCRPLGWWGGRGYSGRPGTGNSEMNTRSCLGYGVVVQLSAPEPYPRGIRAATAGRQSHDPRMSMTFAFPVGKMCGRDGEVSDGADYDS